MRYICAAAMVVGALAFLNRGVADSTSTHTQRMESHGYHRYRGSWRTQQEINLLKQAEAATKSRVEARQRLERLRRELDEPEVSDRVAEDIRRSKTLLRVHRTDGGCL